MTDEDMSKKASALLEDGKLELVHTRKVKGEAGDVEGAMKIIKDNPDICLFTICTIEIENDEFVFTEEYYKCIDEDNVEFVKEARAKLLSI